MKGKGGEAVPGQRIISLAKDFGKLPEEIENMEPYWLNRCLLLQEAESINAKEK